MGSRTPLPFDDALLELINDSSLQQWVVIPPRTAVQDCLAAAEEIDASLGRSKPMSFRRLWGRGERAWSTARFTEVNTSAPSRQPSSPHERLRDHRDDRRFVYRDVRDGGPAGPSLRRLPAPGRVFIRRSPRHVLRGLPEPRNGPIHHRTRFRRGGEPPVLLPLHHVARPRSRTESWLARGSPRSDWMSTPNTGGSSKDQRPTPGFT
jgi:hypothetical protein